MTTTGTQTYTQTYTQAEATDEAVRLMYRKLSRLHPEAFADVWGKLPEGAQEALRESERRADWVHLQGLKAWPETGEDDEDGEA